MKNIKNKKKADLNISIKNNRVLFLFLLVIVPSILYFRVVNFDFSTFDDTNIIVTHFDTIGDIKNIKEAFTQDAFLSKTGDLFYRPLQTISFMLDAQVGGKEPWIYHLSNLIIHILVVIALFFFLIKIGILEEISFLLAVLFSIHPLFTNAVAWVPARGDLLLGLFSLISLITYLEYIETHKTISFIMHIFGFLLAIFSKETAFLLPVLILFYHYFVGREKITGKEIVPFLLSWLLTFVLFFSLRQGAIKGGYSSNIFGLVPFIKNLPTIPITFCKSIFPYNLSTMPLFDNLGIIMGIALIIIFTILIIRFIEVEMRMALWGVLWFLAFTIPPMLFRLSMANIGFEYFEYRTYLPMMGVLVIIGFLVNIIVVKISLNTIFKVSILLIIIYASIAFIHLSAFREPVAFFTNAINANSNNVLALNSRGCIYSKSGDMESSFLDYDNAIKLYPGFSSPYYNKGENYKSMGDHLHANEFYSKALQYDTLYKNINLLKATAYINLSTEKIFLSKYAEAKVLLRKAIRLYPEISILYENYGLAYYNTNQFDSALIKYNQAINLEKNNSIYYDNRGMAKYHLNDFRGSLDDFNKAIELNPDLIDSWGSRGLVKIQLKDYEGAIADLTKAISVKENLGVAWYYRGIAYSKLNNLKEAEINFIKAVSFGYKMTSH